MTSRKEYFLETIELMNMYELTENSQRKYAQGLPIPVPSRCIPSAERGKQTKISIPNSKGDIQLISLRKEK